MLTLDNAHCIYRVPTFNNAQDPSHLVAKHSHHQVYLRSTKLPLPKATSETRIITLLEELGVNSKNLVMPTRTNVELLERLLISAGALVDMKRQFDRVEQEIRTLRAQKEGFIPPVQSRKVSKSISNPYKFDDLLDSIGVYNLYGYFWNE